MRTFFIYLMFFMVMMSFGGLYLKSKGVREICVFNSKKYIGVSLKKTPINEKKCVLIP